MGASKVRWLVLAIGVLVIVLAPRLLLSASSAEGEEPAGTPVAMNITTVTPGGPTVTPTPTSEPPRFITNDSGETAIFMYLTGGSGLSSATGPPDCGAPDYHQQGQVSNRNWAFIEVLWPTACVDPETSPEIGEKVALGYSAGFKRLFSKTFRSEFVTETLVNDTGAAADRLNVEPSAGSIGEPYIVEQPAACPAPTFVFEPLLGQGDVDIVWSTPCVGAGEQVILHLVGSFPGETTPHSWKSAVGGVSLDSDLRGVPLSSERSSGSSVVLAAKTAATVAATASSIWGIAWYAHRRRVGN